MKKKQSILPVLISENQILDTVTNNILIDSEKMRNALNSLELTEEGKIIREDLIGLLEYCPRDQIDSMIIEFKKRNKSSNFPSIEKPVYFH